MRNASFGLRATLTWLGPTLTLAAALLAAPAWAQYKWKDSRGQVHISDLPPPREIPDKDVLQRPAAQRKPAAAAEAAAPPATPTAAAASAMARPSIDPEIEARRKRAEQDAAAKAKLDADKLAAQRTDNCRRARQQLAALDSGQRMAEFDAQGEKIVMDDAARAKATAQARQVIASDCR